MRFIHSAATTLLFKAVAMIAGLAVSIVIARVLGPEGRGIYALIMTIVVMSASFGVFGLTASNTYFIARDPSKARAIGMLSLFAGIAGTLLCIVAVMSIQTWSPQMLQGLNQTLLWLTLALVPLFLWGNLFSFAYLGRGKILAFNTFETGQRVIFLVCAVALLWFAQINIESFMSWVLTAVAVLVTLYLLYYFFSAPAGSTTDNSLNKPALAYGIKSYIATMLTLVVMRSGVLFVNYFNGNVDSGLFAVAQQISELVIIVPTIVGTVLFGRVSRGDSYHLTPLVVRVITLLFLPITVGLFFGSDWLIAAIFGAEFTGSVLLLQIMLPGAFLLGLEVILAQDLAGRGYPWPAVLMWLPTMIVNLFGYLFLIPKLGVSGAAISVSVSFAVIFILIVAYFIRLTNTKLTELFIVRFDDIKIIQSIAFGVFGKNTNSAKAGDNNAVSTVSDQNKVEAQSISG